MARKRNSQERNPHEVLEQRRKLEGVRKRELVPFISDTRGKMERSKIREMKTKPGSSYTRPTPLSFISRAPTSRQVIRNRTQKKGGKQTIRASHNDNTHQSLESKPIFQKCITHGTRAPEDDGGSKEDFERMHEKSIDRELETQEHVVDKRYGDRSRDSI